MIIHAMGKRVLFFALFLVVILAGFTGWILSTSSGSIKRIPFPNELNPSTSNIEAAIPRTAKTPIPTADMLELVSARGLPERMMIQGTVAALTSTTEDMTPRLTPTRTTLAQPISDTLAAAGNLPALEEFSRQVRDGRRNQVRGFYVYGVMALRVVPQPQGDPGYISVEDGTATLFQSAAEFGVTGLLAHNYLSGKEFFRLKMGQELSVVYSDGHIQHYHVSRIEDFQRLSINDLHSNFMELKSGLEKTTDQVFADFYQGEPHLTLQTCIERNGEWSWGIRLIKGEPAD
jgi:hypothetical protein